MKSRFLHATPVEFQLFESILLEDGEYFLLPEHLDRLRESAEYFGFVFTRIEADLERMPSRLGERPNPLVTALSGAFYTWHDDMELGGAEIALQAAQLREMGERDLERDECAGLAGQLSASIG